MSRGALPRIGLLALIWGSGFLWIKLADRGFSPVEVTFGRLALGAIVLFSVVLVRRDRVPRSLRLWALIATAALFGNAVPYLLFATAEQTVASSTAGIVAATTPLWTAILALTVRHQKSLAWRQAAGLAVGFAGAVLIFSPWRTASEMVSTGGLECLMAAASYAVSYVYMDRFLARRGIGTIVLPACQLTAAAVMLAIVLGITGARPPQLTAASITAVAVLGITGTGLAYVLNYQIIASEGATVASTVTYLVPVIAIILGVLALSETITVNMIAGIALVLAGIALTRRQPTPDKKVANLESRTVREPWSRCLASGSSGESGAFAPVREAGHGGKMSSLRRRGLRCRCDARRCLAHRAVQPARRSLVPAPSCPYYRQRGHRTRVPRSVAVHRRPGTNAENESCVRSGAADVLCTTPSRAHPL